ncbi:MAG: PEP-CTERM sorting domain-containing protein [Planctomycetota bacterium]|nr:PEP-CTERM sorting domain-containing protein [Planctomycetota bacterium]
MKKGTISAGSAALLLAWACSARGQVMDRFTIQETREVVGFCDDTILLRANSVSGNHNLWGRLLSTGEVFPIQTNPSADVYDMTLDGRTVLWGQAGSLYAFDLAARTTSLITSESTQGSVSGDWCVWRKWAGGSYPNTTYDIVAFDRATGQKMTISSTPMFRGIPKVSGNWVVWEEYAAGMQSSSVWGYNLSTGQTLGIATGPGSHNNPCINGDIVLWRDFRSEIWGDIYGYNLATHTEFPVAVGAGYGEYPTIPDGDLVAWFDDRNHYPATQGMVGVYDIYRTNLATGASYPIATGNVYKSGFQTSNGVAIWSQTSSNGQLLINGAYLVPEPATLSLLALAGLAMLRRRTLTRPG